jgi:hypothetical protein
MAWNSTAPDGTKSVSANVPILQSNTDYIESTMQLDHYWNEGSTTDGHHKWMQTVATNNAASSQPVNVVRKKDMNVVFFGRFKTPTEATAQQDCQPFVKNLGDSSEVSPFPLGVMQLLGIRAMAVFTCTGVAPVQADLVYSHNIAPIVGVAATDGVDRNETGVYTIRFENELPSSNYLILGGANSYSLNTQFNPAIFSVSSGAGIATRKSKTETVVVISNIGGTKIDPWQFWLICFGG